MDHQPQPFSDSRRNELQRLISCAVEIERKFDIGRARDIRPEFIDGIIKSAVLLRKITKNTSLKNHLADIENTGYAVLDNIKEAGYYQKLRILSAQLKSLKEFL